MSCVTSVTHVSFVSSVTHVPFGGSVNTCVIGL